MRRLMLVLLLLSAVAFPIEAFAHQPDESDDDPKGKVRVTLDSGGHYGPIVYIGFIKNDTQLLTVGKDNLIQVWDVATGNRLRKLIMPNVEHVFCAALSPDEKTVAIGAHGNLNENDPEAKGHGLLFVNLDDGRCLPLVNKTRPQKAMSLAFSPKSGEMLAVGGGKGALVETGGTPAVRIWSNMDQIWSKGWKVPAADRQKFFKPRISDDVQDIITHVEFSPDEERVLFVVQDHHNSAGLFDAKPGGEKKPVMLGTDKNRDYIFGACWNMTGSAFFTGSHAKAGAVKHWNGAAKNAKQFDLFKGEKKAPWLHSGTRLTQLTSLGNFKILVCGEGTLKGVSRIGAGILDVKDESFDPRFGRPELAPELSLTAVSKNKELAVTTVNSGRDVLLWKIAKGKMEPLIEGKAQTPVRVGWLKDKGRHVLAWGYGQDASAAGFGKLTHAFDLDNLRFMDEVKPANYVRRLHALDVVRPDKTDSWSAEYASDNSLTQVQVKKNAKNMALLEDAAPGIFAFTFVPRDGNKPAIAYKHQNSVWLVDPSDGKYIKKFAVNQPHVHDLAPTPDGKYVAVATGNQIITIYSMESSMKLHLFFDGPNWAVWNGLGYYAASPGGEKQIGWSVRDSITKLATFQPLSRFSKHFYRPDVISRQLKTGSLSAALTEANAERKKFKVKVEEEVALEAVLPPEGAIIDVDKSKLPTLTVKASAHVTAAKDGITKLELLSDGRPMFGEKGIKTYKSVPKVEDATWTVDLPSGAHNLTVRIHSEKSLSISTGADVTYAPANPPKLPKARLHVVAIGADQYKHHDGLNVPSAANDAKGIADKLQKNCGLPLFAAVLPQVYTGEQATAANVYKAVKALHQQINEEDVVVIFFGGHGLQAKDGGLYLLTHDAHMDDLENTALVGSKLRKELSNLTCRVILIMDACHSGALGPAQPKQMADTKPVIDDLTRELTGIGCEVVVWSSAMGYEKAQIQGAHGLFTLNFMKALDDKGGAQFKQSDKKMYLHHIQSFVFDKVADDSGQRQHPALNIPWTVKSFPLRELMMKKN